MKLKISNVTKSIVPVFIIGFIYLKTQSFIPGVIGALISIIIEHLLSRQIDNCLDNLLVSSGNNTWEKSQKKLEKEGKLIDSTIVRISFAYLFRIKVDGKYFLVPNTRTGKFQPVGGAYKFNEEEAKFLSENFFVENDDCIPVDKITKRDYRLLIKNKYLKKFMKHFDKTNNRENLNNLSREFIEELIKTKIINKDEFKSLSYRYCGRHMTEIEETVFKPFELLLADVVEVILSDKQEEIFRSLMKKKSNKYIFATVSDIKSCGVKAGTQNLKDSIANHTYKILSESSDLLSKKNKNHKIITIEL